MRLQIAYCLFTFFYLSDELLEVFGLKSYQQAVVLVFNVAVVVADDECQGSVAGSQIDDHSEELLVGL